MRTIQRDIVLALIFSKDGKLFQGKKNPKEGGVYSSGIYSKCWHIPGGGVNSGEDEKAALIREILEETDVDISNYPIELIDDEGSGESEKILKDTGEKVLCQMKFKVFKVIIFDKNADEISISLKDDLAESRWTDLSELPSLELTPPSVVLFTRLGYLPK